MGSDMNLDSNWSSGKKNELCYNLTHHATPSISITTCSRNKQEVPDIFTENSVDVQPPRHLKINNINARKGS